MRCNICNSYVLLLTLDMHSFSSDHAGPANLECPGSRLPSVRADVLACARTRDARRTVKLQRFVCRWQVREWKAMGEERTRTLKIEQKEGARSV